MTKKEVAKELRRLLASAIRAMPDDVEYKMVSKHEDFTSGARGPTRSRRTGGRWGTCASSNSLWRRSREMTKRQMDARREALREYLAETYGDGTVLLDGPEFDGGIVGVTTEGRVAYSYGKLVRALAEANKWSEEDAVDWIEFNTIRAPLHRQRVGRAERPGPRRVPAAGAEEAAQDYPLTPRTEM